MSYFWKAAIKMETVGGVYGVCVWFFSVPNVRRYCRTRRNCASTCVACTRRTAARARNPSCVPSAAASSRGSATCDVTPDSTPETSRSCATAARVSSLEPTTYDAICRLTTRTTRHSYNPRTPACCWISSLVSRLLRICSISVGPFLLLVLRSGTCCPTRSVNKATRQFQASTQNISFFQDFRPSVPSALEIF